MTAVIEVAVNLRAVPQASEGGFQAVLVAFVKFEEAGLLLLLVP